MTDTITIALDPAGTATVTLNRPSVHNALNAVLISELTEALTGFADRPEVRIVVLQASGKSFSAGADLAWMRDMADASEEENYDDAMRLAELLRILNDLPKPTLARIHGAVYGGAVGLITCCDIAVASVRAVFSLSEARLGLIPAVISPYVVKAIGARAARRFFQSAERFDAQQALRIGLVHELAAPERLDETIETLLTALREGGPEAQTAAKRLVAEVDGAPIDNALMQRTARVNAKMRKSAEGREGIVAFLNRRQPAWRK